jgi:5'-nucleotidase / UDP-sugar diphosphatase
MFKSVFYSRCVSILMLLFLSACAGGLQMTILHINDSHSHIESVSVAPVIDGERTLMEAGGLARLSTIIQDTRETETNVVFLHAGDAVQGTLYFTKYNGAPEIQWLNRMNLDAMVTGNHEYDRGSEALAYMVDMAGFPMLAGNVDVSNDPYLAGKLKPDTIIELQGGSVGIIGLVSPDTAETSNPDDTVVFYDITESAERLVQKLRSKGVNKILVLSHIGYERDIALAEQVDHIDIIIGGHTHTLLGTPDNLIPAVDAPYPTVVTGPSGNPVYVLTAWAHTRGIGRLDVTFDRKGNVTICDGYLTIPVGDTFYQRDSERMYSAVDTDTRERILQEINKSAMVTIVDEHPEILEWIVPFRDGIEDLKGRVIGYNPEEILNVRIPGSRHGASGETLVHGSELAPLIADSMLWKTDQTGLNVDFAIQNAGGVRMGLTAGEITVGMVYELLPFENTVYVLDITGRQIRELLESLMERIQSPDNDGAFPYTARLKFTADANRPEGDRITELTAVNQAGEWVPVNPDATYRLATNSYIAAGRDGYTVLQDCDGYRYDTGFQDAEVFMEYIQAIESLSVMEPLITFIP